MRIVAGTLKNRRLETPTWNGLRPTSDKLRETLFNVLIPRVAGSRVLDAYAGTGALGLEAISRGAAHVTFVEQDRRAQALVAANLARCGVTDGYAIIRSSLERAIDALRADAAAASFDIILLDPPYDRSPDAVVPPAAALLAPGGILVLEHARREPAPETAGGLVRTRQIRSGDSMLSFFGR
jgi:16S rRNA (guanine(966)-N(2))-methyltransferase RsmD